MRSSDTPESDLHGADALQQGSQGPSDWSRETPSDDRLSPKVRERLERLRLHFVAGQEPAAEP